MRNVEFGMRDMVPAAALEHPFIPNSEFSFGVKGNGGPRASGARNSGFDSRLPDLERLRREASGLRAQRTPSRLTPVLRPGVVMEACRSDTAAAVVRLHLGPLELSAVSCQWSVVSSQRPTDHFAG